MNALRDEWLARRRKGMGSSDSVLTFLGSHFGKTTTDLWLEKMGRGGEDISGPDIERGNFLEPVAIKKWAESQGIVERVRFPQSERERYDDFWLSHPDLDWMFANLDGRLQVSSGPDEPLEVKCSRLGRYMERKDKGLLESDIIQAQHHLAVSGAPVCHFIVFNAELWEQPLYVPVERDDVLIEQIVERDLEFWTNCVLPQKPPEQTIEEPPLIKRVGGELTDLSDNEGWCEAVELYLAMKENATVAKKELDEAEQLIKDLMREDELTAVLCNDVKFYHQQQEGRVTINTKLLAAQENVDLKKYETRGKPSWSFRAYLPKKKKS